MTSAIIELTANEQRFLNSHPESTVLKWAYHSTLPIDEAMPFGVIKRKIHRLVDPIYEHVAYKTKGYTPYHNGCPVIGNNEDAIGYAAQFFGRPPHGRDWVTRNGVHRYNPNGWKLAFGELHDINTWYWWREILRKVEEECQHGYVAPPITDPVTEPKTRLDVRCGVDVDPKPTADVILAKLKVVKPEVIELEDLIKQLDS